MRDILHEILPFYRDGVRVAVATVINTWSSSPRPVGTSMAVTETGVVIGSVSGGCVEGAVYEVAQEVLETGNGQLVTYGVSDDNAFSAGLTCGGTMQLFVQLIDTTTFPDLEYVKKALADRAPIGISTVVDGSASLGHRLLVTPSNVRGSLGFDRLDQMVTADTRSMLGDGSTGVLHIGKHGERRSDELAIFVESLVPPPHMIVFGANDFAGALARVGKFLGYHVTVCDARPVFATKERFREADEVVVAWPHKYLSEVEVDEHTVLCVLTHDNKFDVPLLQLALRTPAGYVGAMGSRRTHDIRLGRLRENGMAEEDLERLHSPIGLDLGAGTPEETAVSIAAEIISTFYGGTGRSLTNTSASIHREPLASKPNVYCQTTALQSHL